MKRRLFRALTLFISCLIGLLLAELILRVTNIWVGRHSDTMFSIIEYDKTLGWKMKPNITDTVDLVDVEDTPVRSNSAGFWDSEFPTQKRQGGYRVAFLGDSFTWGMGVLETERFTNLLAASNPNWETLNFGIPGYGTDQSLLVWGEIANRYQPDLVVLTVYENDYGDNTCLVRSGRRKPYFELKEDNQIEIRNVPVDATNFWDDGIFNQIASPYASLFPAPTQKRSRIAHWLAKNSNLARLVYTILRPGSVQAEVREPSPVPAQMGAANSSIKPSAEPDLDSTQQLQVRLLSAIVERLAKEVKASGARFVVVLAGQPRPMYEAQKKMFSSLGIKWLDATTDVISNKLTGGQVYYQYSKHWTPEANRAVADLLNQFIREQIICSQCQ